MDGDGYDGPSAYGFGVDCDDYEATTSPGAPATWYDGAASLPRGWILACIT